MISLRSATSAPQTSTSDPLPTEGAPHRKSLLWSVRPKIDDMYHSTICIPTRLFWKPTTRPEPAITELFLLFPNGVRTPRNSRTTASAFPCITRLCRVELAASAIRNHCLRVSGPNLHPVAEDVFPQQQETHQPTTRLPSRSNPLMSSDSHFRFTHQTAPNRLPLPLAFSVLEGEAKAQPKRDTHRLRRVSPLAVEIDEVGGRKAAARLTFSLSWP